MLLRGSNSEKQFSQMDEALNDFTYLSFSEKDWISLAKKFITLKKNGLVVPFQDAMIAYLAIKNNCEVWTNDKHFKLMQVVLPELKRNKDKPKAWQKLLAEKTITEAYKKFDIKSGVIIHSDSRSQYTKRILTIPWICIRYNNRRCLTVLIFHNRGGRLFRLPSFP